MKILCIIASAGQGTRLRLNTPKALLKINNIPLINYSLTLFEKIKSITKIFITYPLQSLKEFESSILNIDKPYKLITGGNTRNKSIYNCLKSIDSIHNFTHILIHDCARIFLSENLLYSLIQTAKEFPVVLPYLQVKDTIKIKENNKIESLNRDNLFQAQTPQIFKADLLYNNYKISNKTDDVGIIEDSNPEIPIKLIKGEEINFKITTPFDYNLAKLIINSGV